MPVTEADLAIDKKLSELCGVIPLLRLVTPVNVTEARQDFFDGKEPAFQYRDLPDLDAIRARLDELSAQEAEDPTISHMIEGLIQELHLRLELLSARESDSFFLTSVEMYGHVDDQILQTAHGILETTYASVAGDETISAEAFAVEAWKEIDHYRQAFPEITATVKISDTTSGVMVETGDLYIGSDTRISKRRISPLLHHEVGTHIVTYENGRAQPLHMLSIGLANYDELQEALGVLAEYLSGGLLPSRLRVLAYRVLAAKMRSENATFREAYNRLTDVGCGRRVAFTTVMRAYRSGGMTKDAIYLRGLVRLLDLIKESEHFDMTPLLVGKVSFQSIPLIRQLLDESILSPPPLEPRYLAEPRAQDRLARLRSGVDVLELGDAA